MQLSQWIGVNEMTHEQAASHFGITRVMVGLMLRRLRTPSCELAAQISAATGGAVTVAELLYPDGVPAGAVMVSQDAPVDSTCAACHAGDTTIPNVPDVHDADEDVSEDDTVPVIKTKAADCAA